MADEITLNLSIAAKKGYLSFSEKTGNFLVTMNGTTGAGGIQTIGTSGELLGVTDVGTAGYAYFRNTSTTTNVEIGTGTTSFVAFLKLKPGESAVCRLGTNAPSAKSSSASVSVDLQYFIFAD
jgi:hypothetical protein